MTYEMCQRCGHDNEPDLERCEQCGARLGVGHRAVALPTAPPAPAYAPAYAPGEVPAGVLPLDFPVRPFESVGDVLGPTFRLYREHLWAVARIVLLGVPTQVLFTYVSERSTSPEVIPCGLVWFASTAVSTLITGALVHTVMTLLRTGVSPTLRESLAWGLRKWGGLFLCTILISLLVGLGSLALCVGAIFLMVLFAVALPAAAAEEIDPIEALNRSVRLTSGHRWLVFVTMLLMWIMLGVAFILNSKFAAPISGGGTQLPLALVSAAVMQLLSSTSTTLSLFIYLSLRVSHGELGAPAALPAAPPPGRLP
jgi:hypothetical protein